ncbi:MAG TPA: YvcK family protein [Patescibacteria group bacterium]|nr:YvcK family protein [Patescibacteria group bacterium]
MASKSGNNGTKSRGAGAIRIVALGGGTGLSTLLRGLKGYVSSGHSAAKRSTNGDAPIADLAAIVTVSDDGGSSGRLRREYSILPPGDLRNCMVALSQDEALLSRLFQYRFQSPGSLKGHSFGNLFLAALTKVTGDFPEAVRLCSEVLAIRGRIFPATSQLVTLRAELANGRTVRGETRISRSRSRIRRVRLEPRRVRPLAGALEAIRGADLIVLGPGSLYTSIIPNLLVAGVADAIRKSRATRVYIANIMTQPGETDGYSVADHVRAIYEHAGGRIFDWVVVNNQEIPAKLLKRYHAEGAEPVRAQVSELQKLGVHCIFDHLVAEGDVVRHDAARLTRLLLEEFVARRPE